MEFTRKFKPESVSSILQAPSCRFCQLKLGNPSKLVISKKWKLTIASLVHNARGLFSNGPRLSRQKPARLALPDTRPTLLGKIPGGIFELNESQTNLES
jgi:hypothetical protein